MVCFLLIPLSVGSSWLLKSNCLQVGGADEDDASTGLLPSDDSQNDLLHSLSPSLFLSTLTSRSRSLSDPDSKSLEVNRALALLSRMDRLLAPFFFALIGRNFPFEYFLEALMGFFRGDKAGFCTGIGALTGDPINTGEAAEVLLGGPCSILYEGDPLSGDLEGDPVSGDLVGDTLLHLALLLTLLVYTL